MKMNPWENTYIQIYHQQDQLITEQINELVGYRRVVWYTTTVLQR